MDYTGTALPLTAPIGGNYGGFGNYGMGAVGGGAVGLILGLLLQNGGFGGLGGGGTASLIGANTAGQIAGLEAGVANIQNTMSDSAVMDALTSGFNNVYNGLITTNSAIDANARTTQAAVGDLSTALASGNFTTLTSINGLGRDITAQNNQNAMFNLNSFNQLNTAMLQGFNEVGRDSANYFNQIVAGQAALANNMAQCCCDIKQTIMVDGNSTRALINQINMERIQGELNDAKNQISNSNQTNALVAAMAAQTSTIIQHLAPRITV